MNGSIYLPNEAPAVVTLTDKETGCEVYRTDTEVGTLEGTRIVLGITWNARSVSGGVFWANPATGKHYPRGLTMRVFVTHPDTGEQVEVSV